jgi:hypothetical protein
MKRHSTIALWMPVRLSPTNLASLNGCGCPWWDMSRCALDLKEGGHFQRTHSFSLSSQIKFFETLVVIDLFLVFGMYTRAENLSAQSQSQIHVATDGQSVNQSVCLGVQSTLELVTRYYFLSESCCFVSVVRPLWREVGSISCQSLSALFSPLSKCNFYYFLHVTPVLCI